MAKDSTERAIRYWVVLYVVFAGAVLLAATWNYRRSRDQLLVEIYSDMRTVSSLKAFSIDRWRSQRLGHIAILANDTLLIGAVEKAGLEPGNAAVRMSIEDRLERVATTLGYSYALLGRTAGKLLASSHNRPANLDSTLQPLVKLAVAAKEPVMGKFVQGADGSVGIDTLGRMVGAAGTPVAVIILHSPATSLGLGSTELRNTLHGMTTTLVAKEGADIAYIADSIGLENQNHHIPALSPELHEAFRSEGQFRSRDLRGKFVLGYALPIQGTDWTVFATVQEETFHNEARENLTGNAIVAALMLLVAATAIGYTHRRDQARVFQALLKGEQDQRKSLAVYQANLQENEEFLRRLMQHMQVGVLVQGPQTEMLMTNPKALDLLGLTEEQLFQRTSFDPTWNVIHEDGSPFPGPSHPVSVALATGRPILGVIMGVFRPATQSRVWLLVDAIPWKSAENEPIRHVVCTFTDVTLLKATEAALRESEVLNASVLDSLSEQIAVLDFKGEVVAINEAWRNFSCENSTGDHYSSPEHMRLFRAASDPALAVTATVGVNDVLSGTLARFSLQVSHRIGEEKRWFLMRVSRLAGRLPGAVVAYENISAQKFHEMEVLEAHAQLSATVSAIPDILFEFDAGGRCTACRAPQENLLPAAPATLVGKTIREIFPSEAAQVIHAALLEAGLSGHVSDYQFELQLATGLHTFEISASRKPMGDKKAPHFVMLARDTTEKSVSRKLILENEARMHSIINSSPVPFALLGANGRVLFVNPAFITTLGYTAQEVPSLQELSERAFADPAYRKWVSENWPISRGGEPLEVRLRRSDGAEITMLASATPLNEGRDGISLLVLFDITRQKQAETEQRQANEKLSLQGSALNAAAFAIMITDAGGKIQWVNKAFVSLSGYSFEECIGSTPGSLLNSGTHGNEFYSDLWQTILAGKVWQREVMNRRKDGTVYPDEVTITPVVDETGAVVNFISFRRDLTAEKQREARFLQAQKMEVVGQFAAGIAHNFNNILTGIQATAAATAIGLIEDDPVRQSLREIAQNVDRGATLTRQLQNFRQGPMTADPVYVDITELTAGLMPMVRRLLTADIEVNIESEGTVAGVLMDRGQFEQIFLNLVTNARDAMLGGGTLAVRIQAGVSDRESGDWVKLDVTDTGSGMDQETLSMIFEPFYTTKPPGMGTGLGLSTVYNIVRHNGGQIWATSELHRGTTMSLILPRAIKSVTPSQPAAEVHAPLPRGTETLLIVEDEEIILRSIKKLLAASGYVVLAAASADEALELLSIYKGPVHLVLADTVMPGMSGLKLAEIVAVRRPGIHILHMSALSAEEILQRGGNMAASNFIQKPFPIQELARKIRRMIDEPQPRQTHHSEQANDHPNY